MSDKKLQEVAKFYGDEKKPFSFRLNMVSVIQLLEGQPIEINLKGVDFIIQRKNKNDKKGGD